MREIKFRGKRIDNGEWVYGSLVNNLYEHVDTGEPVAHIVTTDNCDSCSYICDEDYFICEDCFVEVDPATVGQCTGLKDMHGVKLYEGDIMGMGFHAHGYYCIGVVQYSNAGAAFGVKCKTASETETCPYLDVVINNHRAVKIGNIHDNPELLKT